MAGALFLTTVAVVAAMREAHEVVGRALVCALFMAACGAAIEPEEVG